MGVGVFVTNETIILSELGACKVLDVGVIFKICWNKVHLWVHKREI